MYKLESDAGQARLMSHEHAKGIAAILQRELSPTDNPARVVIARDASGLYCVATVTPGPPAERVIGWAGTDSISWT